MKKLLQTTVNAMIVLLSVFLLGIFLPLLVSIFLMSMGVLSGQECVSSNPFWYFSIIGWIFAALYVNIQVRKLPNNIAI